MSLTIVIYSNNVHWPNGIEKKGHENHDWAGGQPADR